MEKRDIHIHYHGLNEREVVETFGRHLSPIARKIDMISQEVQEVLDKAKKNETVVGSLKQAMDGLKTLTGDLQRQIEDLKTNRPLSEEDKAALLEASTDLSDAIGIAESAIPANVPPDQGGAPVT